MTIHVLQINAPTVCSCLNKLQLQMYTVIFVNYVFLSNDVSLQLSMTV